MSDIDSDSIAEIVRNIWDSVLSIQVVASDAHEQIPNHGDALTACVQISGGWAGVISAEFSPELAQTSSAAMLGVEGNEIAPDDLRDALGELANMIGGNIKALLPQPSQLSLPWVTSGGAYSLQFPHCTVIERVTMTSDSGMVVVTVLAHQSRLPRAEA